MRVCNFLFCPTCKRKMPAQAWTWYAAIYCQNVANRNKTPEKILGLEHPPAELLVSDRPTVPTAHLILSQICRYLYLHVQYSDIQTHTVNTIRYIRIQTYTDIYRQIHIYMHSVKTGLGGVFSCGQRPLMTLWPCSDQADLLG